MHYVIIMMKITWSLKVIKCFSIENVNGPSVVFTILHQNNGFKKLIKNDNLMSNKDSKSMFIRFFCIFTQWYNHQSIAYWWESLENLKVSYLTCYFLYYM